MSACNLEDNPEGLVQQRVAHQHRECHHCVTSFTFLTSVCAQVGGAGVCNDHVKFRRKPSPEFAEVGCLAFHHPAEDLAKLLMSQTLSRLGDVLTWIRQQCLRNFSPRLLFGFVIVVMCRLHRLEVKKAIDTVLDKMPQNMMNARRCGFRQFVFQTTHL